VGRGEIDNTLEADSKVLCWLLTVL